jgi:SOS-response transcriptional repressor LexA
MSMGLTRKEYDLLAFIESSIKTSGIAPSFAEMQTHMRLHSTNSVSRLIYSLESRGRIRRLRYRARAIEIIPSNPACCPHCGESLDKIPEQAAP